MKSIVTISVFFAIAHLTFAASSFYEYGTGYKWAGTVNGINYRYSRPPYVYTATGVDGKQVSYSFNYYYEVNGGFSGPWYIGDRVIYPSPSHPDAYISGWKGPFANPSSSTSPHGDFVCPTVLNGDKMIGVYGPAFRGTGITSLTIQSPMSTLGGASFASCPVLHTVILPDTLETIGGGSNDGAFESCGQLRNITLPESLSFLGERTFCKCESLKSMRVPSKVKNVAASVFYGCGSLRWCEFASPNLSSFSCSAIGSCTNLVAVFLDGNEPESFGETEKLDTLPADTTLYVRKGAVWSYDGKATGKFWPTSSTSQRQICEWGTSDIKINKDALEITKKSLGDGKCELTIESTLNPSVVFYTIDGSEPSWTGLSYTEPIVVAEGTEVRAVAISTAGNIAFADLNEEEPRISIMAKPRYPWNGKVDLKFTIDGTSGTKYDTSFTAKDVAGGTNLTMKTLYKSDGTAANVAKEQLLPGTYNWVWDAMADLGTGTVLERVAIIVDVK